MEGLCKIHGKTDFGKRSDRSKGRCKKGQVEAVQKRRQKIKIDSVIYKGGKCENCGYNKCIGALEFHHRNPAEKDFGIGSKGYTRSWEKVKKELDKCALLCANCHSEEHNPELTYHRIK